MKHKFNENISFIYYYQCLSVFYQSCTQTLYFSIAIFADLFYMQTRCVSEMQMPLELQIPLIAMPTLKVFEK
jgi:hypothetical protein